MIDVNSDLETMMIQWNAASCAPREYMQIVRRDIPVLIAEIKRLRALSPDVRQEAAQ